ncbi:hypothetical protein MKW92_023344, partial [Papaver armeniacum]
VLTAKRRYLEKGPLRQTRLLHESSSSYEMDGETLEGSVYLAAPECKVTNQNCEIYDHKHEGSVPVDIPECETAKDVVVDSINSKKKKKDKVVPTSKAAPVATGTVAEQLNMEDHLIEAPKEEAPEEYELRGAGKFVRQPSFFQQPNRQALKIAAKFHEQRNLVENEWEEERLSRLRVEDQLLNTQNMVSRLEETLANLVQNDELKKQENNGSLVCDGNIEVPTMALAENEWQEERVSRLRVEDQLLNTQNMVSRLEEMLANFMQNGKDLASVSTLLPTYNNEDLGVEPASTATLVPVNNSGNLEERLASTSNRVSINNKVNLRKGPAVTSTRIPISNKENLGKGPASTSTKVQLKNNESLGNSPASSSDRANSNNYEPSTSGRSQSRVWRNGEENLPVVQVISSRHVASVKDSNVSPFQRFYNRASQKLTGSIPFISVPVDAAVFGTEMELYLDLDDVQYICHMEDLSENCVMAYIR